MAQHLPRSRTDALVALVGLVLCETAVWVRVDAISTPVAGGQWLLVVYPLLLAVPLAWRRQVPLAAYTVIVSGVALQAVVTGDSPEGLPLMYTWGAGTYAVAAYSDRRQATTGLAVGLLGYALYALNNHDIQTGKASEQWAGSFFAMALLTVWLVGVFVRNRRQERLAEQRAQALERHAREAVADERARLARELHDVISHNLSVMVVQAAGARAAGNVDPSTLEKIENSGRESLVEMRRLLGVLRREDESAALAPQPGIGQIGALAHHVRAAGVPIEITIEGDYTDLPQAVDLSVYRIVQESLTNVLKHARDARATVVVDCAADAITIDVVDDGTASNGRSHVGHGLIGMRERVAMFGGELIVGQRPTGGFAVHARLPRKAPSS